MIKTNCDNCMHEKICALKSVMNAAAEKIETSGTEMKHPSIVVHIKCMEYLDLETVLETAKAGEIDE